MKRTLVAVAVLFLLLFAGAATAQDKQPTSAKAIAPQLEANIRKVWEAFKAKDKVTLAAMLDDRFREVEDGSAGFGDKKTDIAMVDEFEITTYSLKDFKVTPLGPNTALITYLAHYESKAGGQTTKANTAFGEVWVKVGSEWKALYTQETALK